ncbi:hypothetical protein [Streptomyces sp. NPDC059080]|uniref:hypothetical protein n=1 Tax=Streptomyces sp. NPDC059080 TaxID=3346718 RepID=UPI00369E2B83
MPELDYRALKDLHDYHFPGGSEVDSSKGLFRPDLTDGELEAVFNAGLRDAGTFKPNASFYYEKTFPYSGIGTSSATNGGGPSSQVTLVIGKHGDVITMYPV